MTQALAQEEFDLFWLHLSQNDLAALASVVGNDLRRADNELLKLVSFTAGEPIDEKYLSQPATP